MSEPLENFIKNNKQSFDVYNAPEGLWDKLEEQLNTHQKKQQKSGNLNLFITVFKIAALFIMVLSFGFLWGNYQKQQSLKLENINPAYAKKEIQFSSLIESKQEVLKDLNIEKALIGYEPVWSIGVNGTPAEAGYVEESFVAIKSVLTELGLNLKNFPLCYGGSVNIDNAKELASLDNCDGLFVGRSAWSKDGFRNVYEKAHSGYNTKINKTA